MSTCSGINETLNHPIYRYILGGFSTMIVNWGTFFILVEFVKLHYLICLNLATLVAWTYSFIINKFFVFRDLRKSYIFQGGKFLVQQITLLALSNLIMYFQTSILQYNLYISWFIIAAIMALLNYIGMKVIVFKGA